MSTHITAKLFQGLPGLKALHPSWQKIVKTIEDVHFVQHPSWHFAIQKWLLPEQVNYVLLEDANEPVAIVPIVIQKHLHGRYTITSPQHDHISLSDWICAPHDEIHSVTDWIPQIVQAMDITLWDKFVFESFIVSPSLRKTSKPEHIPANNFLSTVAAHKKTAWFDCRSSINPVSAKMRRNLRRLKFQALKLGRIDLLQNGEGDDFPKAFEEFLNVESSGWKGLNGTHSAINIDETLQGFYQELFNNRAPGFKPTIYLLKINGKTVGAQFVVITGECINILKTTYDESYAKYSPGSILLSEVIDFAVSDNSVNRVSLVTDPAWADRWHPKKSVIHKSCAYNNTTSGVAVRQLDELKAFARSAYKEFLQK